MTTQNNQNETDRVTSLFLAYSPTEAEVVRNLNLVKIFFEQYYFTEGKDNSFEEAVAQVRDLEDVTQTDQELMADIFKHHLPFFPKESFYQALDSLGQVLYKLPRVLLQIPVRLDYTSLQKISAWIRSSVAANALLNIKVNPLLVAGCGITWNSRHVEYSVDEKITMRKHSLFSLLPKI